jgi:hypothetical protein
MKTLFVLVLLACTLVSRTACADTSKHMVRIACVPEAGLLDVESRLLHDSVSGDPDPDRREERHTRLAQAGFHDPHGLTFSCVLGAVTYVITAEQGQESDSMCGGDPEVVMNVRRDGEAFISNVVFGESCKGLPSVTRFTVGDGPGSWRGRETMVCYSSGKEGETDRCDWTFGSQAEFAKRFPVDEGRIRQIVTREEKR